MVYSQISVAIVSANEIEREGLRRILKEGGFTAFAMRDGDVEVELGGRLDEPTNLPVFIVDRSAEQDCPRICADLRLRWPACRIIVMSGGCDSRTVVSAFRAGVDGFVGKHISCASLAEVIKLVALGEKIVPYQIVLDMPCVDASDGLAESRIDNNDARLSERQIDILRGLARGEPNKVISRRLSITEATVKVHVKSILRKIGVTNRTQAAVWAIEAGLADTPDAIGDAHPRANGAAMPVLNGETSLHI